jgi:predicted glycoside hydrolase/deacetylase ChbG (UPF0249 family)
MVTKKQIIVCADDYGLYVGCTQAILKLVEQGRLSAVSCVMNVPQLFKTAQQLLDLKADIDIGLHFNLTEGEYCSRLGKALPGLTNLLLASQLRLLSAASLKAELQAQLDRFIQAYGRLPDFIDGHQHVHHLPVVRDALLAVYNQRLQGSGCYLRSVFPNFMLSPYRLKATVLNLTGAYALKKLLHNNQLPHNTGFAGIYGFSNKRTYRHLFNLWLQQLPAGGLLMCHPGLAQLESGDPIAKARYSEYDYLQSKEFLQDCDQQAIELIRFKQLSSS